MANREQRTVEAIDALVQDSCPVCQCEWHGLSDGYCPGAWASPEQRADFEQHRGEREDARLKAVTQSVQRPRRRPPWEQRYLRVWSQYNRRS